MVSVLRSVSATVTEGTVTEQVRILIAEDDPQDLENLVTILQNEGYLVDGARNGEEALQRLRENPYQMVITDLRMPKQDGLEVLARIREDYPRVGVMVITGYPSLDSSIQSLRGEAFDYIVKPFDVDYLKLRVANCLERMRSQGEVDFERVAQTFGLTGREIEVVQNLYQGLSNAEIASNLKISEGTVKIHLEHVFRKAGVKSRTALLARIRDL